MADKKPKQDPKCFREDMELSAHAVANFKLKVKAGQSFEDAVREIYTGNKVGYDHFTYDWPRDIRDHGRNLAFPE